MIDCIHPLPVPQQYEVWAPSRSRAYYKQNYSHPIFEDAGPGRCGHAIINQVFDPLRRSVIDYLWLAGDSRIGALAFSGSPDAYIPDAHAVYTVADLWDLFVAADALARRQPISHEMKRLLQPESSAGGTRATSARRRSAA